MENDLVFFQGAYAPKNIRTVHMQGYKNPWGSIPEELTYEEILAYEKGQTAARQDELLESTF